MRWRNAIGLILWLSLPLLGGCLERKERLAISADGSVWIEAEFKTDSLDELYKGDAIPTPAGGWAVEQLTERDDKGKEAYKLIATASIPPRRPLPATFATRGDADQDLYLQFPTTLKIEQRGDGVYYHFRRVYPARPWEYIERLQRQFVQEPLNELEPEPETWLPEERISVVKALATFEVEKALVFARAAFLETTPDGPQDGWLHVQDDLRGFVNQMDFQTLAQLLEPRESENEEHDRDAKIQAEAQKFEAASIAQLKTTLKSLAGYDQTNLNAFMNHYERQKKRYAVTQDLDDDKLEIAVEMPGQIIAHNADDVSASTANWTLEGPQLHDCERELLVTSRVAN
jgi:hypothetical protein